MSYSSSYFENITNSTTSHTQTNTLNESNANENSCINKKTIRNTSCNHNLCYEEDINDNLISENPSKYDEIQTKADELGPNIIINHNHINPKQHNLSNTSSHDINSISLDDNNNNTSKTREIETLAGN